MTEYWVSQGNKWCDFCKIFISNNPSSIRNHELGQRHKENVAKRLTNMRKETATKKKEEEEAVRTLQQIEVKAKRSYQKDIEARDSNAHALEVTEEDQEKWEYNSTSGYYYNQSNGLYYDPNSGFYYSDAIGNATGKWVTQDEAYSSSQVLSNSKQKEPILKKPSLTSKGGPATEKKDTSKLQNGHAPGPIVSSSLNPMRTVKGAPSSVSVTKIVNKRKRQEDKPKVLSSEDAAALKAREAAKKRVEEREKPLLGLYKSR